MAKTTDTALLVGGGFALWLLLGGGAKASSKSADGSADGDGPPWEEGWPEEWDAATQLDVTPDVPPIPREPPKVLPKPGQPVEDRGGVTVDVKYDPKQARPPTADEVREWYGREPTAAELRAFELWSADNPDLARVIMSRGESSRATPKATPATADAKTAARAAQLAAAAVTKAPSTAAKQATGNKVSAMLRTLGTGTALASAAPSAPASRTVEVKTAQTVLNGLGEKLKVDGAYGPKTAQAWARQATKLGQRGTFARVGPKSARVETSTADALARAAKARVAPSRVTSKSVAVPEPKRAAPTVQQTRKVAAPKGTAPKGTNVALAKSTAADVAAHLRNKGRKYTVAVVRQFQERAGLKADGLYGPATASALRYFGANAPAPLYKGANAKYVPPT